MVQLWARVGPLFPLVQLCPSSAPRPLACATLACEGTVPRPTREQSEPGEPGELTCKGRANRHDDRCSADLQNVDNGNCPQLWLLAGGQGDHPSVVFCGRGGGNGPSIPWSAHAACRDADLLSSAANGRQWVDNSYYPQLWLLAGGIYSRQVLLCSSYLPVLFCAKVGRTSSTSTLLLPLIALAPAYRIASLARSLQIRQHTYTPAFLSL